MSGFRVTLETEACARDIERLSVDFRKVARKILVDVVTDTERRAKDSRTYRDRTGTLRKNTSGWYNVSDFSGFVIAHTHYSKYVDAGTKPHEIKARRAPFLRFYWEKLGRWVALKKVNHPGTKPYMFMQNAEAFGRRMAADYSEDKIEFLITQWNSHGG